MQATVSFAKCLFSNHNDKDREGYFNRIFEPDTVSDDEDYDDNDEDEVGARGVGHAMTTTTKGKFSCDRDVAFNSFDVGSYLGDGSDGSVEGTSRLGPKLSKTGPFSRVTPSMRPLDILNSFSQDSSGDESSLDGPVKMRPSLPFDRYGFIIENPDGSSESQDVNNDDDDKGADGSASKVAIMESIIENNLRSKWISFLELNYVTNDNLTTSSKLKWSQVDVEFRRSRNLEELVTLGLPHSMRSQLWLRLSRGASYATQSNWSYSEMVDRSKTEMIDESQIVKVLPQNACFASSESIGTPRLTRISKVLKWFVRQVEHYSMSNVINFDNHDDQQRHLINIPLITSYLLLICEEEESFWLIFAIFREWRSIDHSTILKRLVRGVCPEIHQVLTKDDIDLSLITNDWFSSLFCNFLLSTTSASSTTSSSASDLKCDMLYRLWDFYFYYGPVVFFQLFVAILTRNSDFIKDATDDASLFNRLEELPTTINSLEQLVDLLRSGQSLVPHLEIFGGDDNSDRSLSVGGRSSSSIEPSLSRRGSLVSTNDSDIRTKNIVHTSLLLELHESIVAIAKHFETNDPRFKPNLTVNLDDEDEGCEDGDIGDESKVVTSPKPRLAKALTDFSRTDSDELGFRKNDIITIVNERDEHCWIGELNGVRGWFPAKFVQILERNDDYSSAGDDSVTPFINDLVRGRLSSSIKQILIHGLKRGRLVTIHPWTIIEEIAHNSVSKDFRAISSKLNLTKSYRLDDDFQSPGSILSPLEVLFRNVTLINETHLQETPFDVRLRSLITISLNQRNVHKTFDLYASASILPKYYHDWAFVRSPVSKLIRSELKLLNQFVFNLNPLTEIIGIKSNTVKSNNPNITKDSVQEMLVKHHLFSWDVE